MLSLVFDFPDLASYIAESFNSMIFKWERIITAELFEGVYASYSCCIELIVEVTELNSVSDKEIQELPLLRSSCEVYENVFSRRIKLNSST